VLLTIPPVKRSRSANFQNVEVSASRLGRHFDVSGILETSKYQFQQAHLRGVSRVSGLAALLGLQGREGGQSGALTLWHGSKKDKVKRIKG
jgi:hypothetical protein